MTRKQFIGAMVLASLAWGAHLTSMSPGARVMAADKPEVAAPSWSPKAAAQYLDSRETWWQSWDRAHKDRGTLCVSCHTQASYALARPALRGQAGEHALSAPEQVMLASVEKRVREWKDVQPFYSDAIYGAGKEVESRNAESVLNAIILDSYDVPHGGPERTHAHGIRQCMGAAIEIGSGCGRVGVAELRVHTVGVKGVAIPLGGTDGDCCWRRARQLP